MSKRNPGTQRGCSFAWLVAAFTSHFGRPRIVAWAAGRGMKQRQPRHRPIQDVIDPPARCAACYSRLDAQAPRRRSGSQKNWHPCFTHDGMVIRMPNKRAAALIEGAVSMRRSCWVITGADTWMSSIGFEFPHSGQRRGSPYSPRRLYPQVRQYRSRLSGVGKTGDVGGVVLSIRSTSRGKSEFT